MGDYTRRLAAAVARQDIPVEIVATHDTEVKITQECELQEGEERIPCLRIAFRDSGAREKALRYRIPKKEEIWSFQFSGFYAYHPKGWPYTFHSQIARHLKNKPLHIMCHEIGLNPYAAMPLKRKILGILQRKEFLRFLRQSTPLLIHTHTPYYRSWLENLGWEASLLQLFGNIPRFPSNGWTVQQLNVEQKKGEVGWVVGVFGTVHPDWNPLPFFDRILPILESRRIHLILTFIGRSGSHLPQCVTQLQNAYGDRLSTVVLGEQPPKRIADFFSILRFGLSTNGWGLNAKSGTVAAMLDHGVPVVVLQNTLYASYGEVREGLIREESFFSDLEKARVAVAKQGPCLQLVADQFLEDLREAAAKPLTPKRRL